MRQSAYFLVPLLGLLLFAGAYWRHLSTQSTRQAIDLAEAAQIQQRQIAAEQAERQATHAAALAAQAERREARALRQAEEARRRAALESLQAERGEIYAQAQTLRREADRLRREIQAAEDAYERAARDLADLQAERAHLDRLLPLAQANLTHTQARRTANTTP